MTTHLETISTYYDGCSTGDVDLMVSTLHPEVVHYFLAPNVGSTPVGGAEHLARYWRKVHGMIQAVWVVDHIVTDGSESVIEWSMFWTPAGSSRRVVTRGAEWFQVADGKITEIRSYYQQLPQDTGLDAFPYPDRGYSTVGAERSGLHDPDGALA